MNLALFYPMSPLLLFIELFYTDKSIIKFLTLKVLVILLHLGHFILYLAFIRGSDSQILICSAHYKHNLCEQLSKIGTVISY